MASDIWLRSILIVREETCCRHIGYSLRLTARVLLYVPSHRQDNTYHSLCYTSRGALAGMRNSSMGPPHEGSIRRRIAPWANALTMELHLAPRLYGIKTAIAMTKILKSPHLLICVFVFFSCWSLINYKSKYSHMGFPKKEVEVTVGWAHHILFMVVWCRNSNSNDQNIKTPTLINSCICFQGPIELFLVPTSAPRLV